MRLNKSQSGFTLWSLAILLFLLGFSVFTAIKLMPVYMEDFYVGSALESLQSDPEEFRGALSLRDAVIKRLDINNVTRVGRDDISIIREGQRYVIEITYEVVVPFMGNISLLLDFNHSTSVRASV